MGFGAAAVAAVVLLAAGPCRLWAAPLLQGADPSGVRAVRVDADARAQGAAAVTVRYEVELAAGTARIPFTAIHFDPARVGAPTARVGNESLPVEITDPGPPRVTGHVVLPEAVRARTEAELVLRYRVEGAVSSAGGGVQVVLPVLAVDWAPTEPSPDMFTAEVRLPEDMAAREVFPTTNGSGSTPGLARASLQVVPSVVRVQARPAGAASFSLPQALELLVLGVVVALGIVGLRWLRLTR